MKIKRSGVCVCVALIFQLPVSASLSIKLSDDVGSGPGGAFKAQVISGSVGNYHVGNSFQTFCIEHNEYVRPGYIYDVQISTVAKAGGAGGVDASLGGDPLDARTAYLYTQWVNGSIAHDQNHADALQDVIWLIEQEILALKPSGTTVGGIAAALLSGANSAVAVGGVWYQRWGNGAGGYDGLNYLGNVRVMNLTNPNNTDGLRDLAGGIRRQDQLVMVPTPAASCLCLIGCGIIGWIKRRGFDSVES